LAVAIAAIGLGAPDAGMRAAHRAGTEAAHVRVAHRHARPRRAHAQVASSCNNRPPPLEHTIRHRQWLSGTTITEYYPAPERWFVGRHVGAPGLAGGHAVDWLYGPHGLAMQGEGVDGSGRPVHIALLGSTGWVNGSGRPTLPVCLGQWTAGLPAWLSGGWRNARGAVTFPLASGGWSDGRGGRVLAYGGVTFAAGRSLPLRYYHSIA
jgi:hypothetical protein